MLNRRMRRELFCLWWILFAGLVPSLGGMVLAGYLDTKGWPEGFCVPFGIVSLAAGIITGFLMYSFVTASPGVKAWIEEPKKEKTKPRPPRYGAWHESDEHCDR